MPHYPRRYTKTYRLYRIWMGMKTRCYNKRELSYKHYGAKGIVVCDEWLLFDNFEIWAMNHGYEDTLEIDRIDNSIGYNPSNCRWVTAKVQSNNRAFVKKYEFKGLNMNLTEWAIHLGVKRKRLSQRLNAYKWPIHRVLSIP